MSLPVLDPSRPGLSAPLRPRAAVHLSVVIPAYNEERRLPESLRKIRDYLERSGRTWEILVVDDGSRDGTLGLMRSFEKTIPGLRVISYGANRGKGYAVRAGVSAAAGEHVLFTDADLSTPIEELGALLPHLEAGADVVIGSRYLRQDPLRVRQPLYRKLMGRGFSTLVSLVGVRGVRDTQCGFKLFRAPVAQELFGRLRTHGFAFDVEILMHARNRGLRIREIPVRWTADADSRVRPVRDSLRMVMELLRLRGIL